MNDSITYLCDNIQRKLLLAGQFRIPKKAEKLIDGAVIDVEKIRGVLAKQAKDTQAAKAEDKPALGERKGL